MQKSKFLILFILLFSIFGCGNKQKDSIDKQKKKTYNLIGKRITSIDSIVPDKNPRVIFLFNYYDCGSCVDSGFSIANKIDSLCRKRKVAIIQPWVALHCTKHVMHIMNIYTLIQKI